MRKRNGESESPLGCLDPLGWRLCSLAPFESWSSRAYGVTHDIDGVCWEA
jgi:hypothetical protein